MTALETAVGPPAALPPAASARGVFELREPGARHMDGYYTPASELGTHVYDYSRDRDLTGVRFPTYAAAVQAKRHGPRPWVVEVLASGEVVHAVREGDLRHLVEVGAFPRTVAGVQAAVAEYMGPLDTRWDGERRVRAVALLSAYVSGRPLPRP